MIKKITLVFVLAFLMFACSSSSDSPEKPIDSFDRGALLKNIAENFIMPSFKDFNAKLSDLKSKTENFTKNPSQSNLESLRSSWLSAYKKWQTVAPFNIGKAEELQFLKYYNVYPLNVDDVETNISNGTYDLTHVNNQDAQGFPALDYLVNGIDTSDNGIINKYREGERAQSYKDYIVAVVNKMIEVNSTIYNDWKDSYSVTFVSNTGNTATSSLNKFVNDYIYYFEKQLRANKIGIPAGNFSATPLPEKVEAYYKKDVSKQLVLEALNNFQSIFNGNNSNSSLKSYLVSLKRSDLASEIINQLNTAKSTINQLDNNFYKQITTDNTKMTQAYDELQKAVVLLKVDMLQALNIGVDYVDADGD